MIFRKVVRKKMDNFSSRILASVQTSLIDSNSESLPELRPKLLFNDTSRGSTMLAYVLKELQQCESFWFSVAFITKSGLIALKDIFKEMLENGIQGRILTTDYLTFNEPGAFRELLEFPNIEIRIYEGDFHTKGYMFKNSPNFNFILGSSNLTQSALKSTKEWNLKISSLEQGELLKETNYEFSLMWNKAMILDEKWIAKYELKYNKAKQIRKQYKPNEYLSSELIPNMMQKAAVSSLMKLRNEGKDKALIISATGTGKTYLSAFDVKKMKPGKLLFLVHREQILRQAEESFKNVLGQNIQTGFLTGTSKQTQADYIFSTINMMSKESVHNQFETDFFDYIIIDETHRAGAESYRNVINYFKPQFLLGMTATPERTDGFDIYELYDHNIAYEIRLQQAMEEDMLCPFHYFGITDIVIDDVEIDDTTEFRYLVNEKRVDYILEKARFYGHSGERVRGLVFCSRKEEARELSRLFNERGYRTLALCGENNQNMREDAIKRLEQNDTENGIDYIFTVDIMNEGVDVPCINQIIMLRPTQSSIIFTQQLGRGLRKYEDKEYLVIIDFIGNYKNNFLIPIALSGERSFNKDTIRRYVAEGNRMIPGCSTVNFDEISKKRIYDAIDNAKLNGMRLIREEYNNLKFKLGHIPTIEDFENFGTIDIIKIFDRCGSYYNFLIEYDDKDYSVRLNDDEEKIIKLLSKKIAKGKRVHELEMLKRIVKYRSIQIREYKELMNSKYGIKVTHEEEKSMVSNMRNEFPAPEEQKKYSSCVFLEKEAGEYSITSNFKRYLENPIFSQMVEEIVDYGVSRYQKLYSQRYMHTNFSLYQKYTYEDVCRLLNWSRNVNAQNIGGYFYDKETKTMPVFINYVKEEGSIAYEDRFISTSRLIALSKPGRKLESTDMQHIYNAKEEENKIYLFMRKVKDDKEAYEFYFLGGMEAIGEPKATVMKDTNKSVIEITYQLYTPVRDDIFDYFMS